RNLGISRQTAGVTQQEPVACVARRGLREVLGITHCRGRIATCQRFLSRARITASFNTATPSAAGGSTSSRAAATAAGAARGLPLGIVLLGLGFLVLVLRLTVQIKGLRPANVDQK